MKLLEEELIELLIPTIHESSYTKNRLLYYLNIAQVYAKLNQIEEATRYYRIASHLCNSYLVEVYMHSYGNERDADYLSYFSFLRNFHFLHVVSFDEFLEVNKIILPGNAKLCMEVCFRTFQRMIDREIILLNDKNQSTVATESLSVKEFETENPNDWKSKKAVRIDFYDDGKKIGTTSISGIDTDEGFLYEVEVFKKYRGKGYGSQIIKYCIDHYPVKELTVETSNEVAIHLYKKFGFKIKKTFKDDGKEFYDMWR